jgi:hypothetical protein
MEFLIGKFHLSPHENIFTILLINIHCLYTIILHVYNAMQFIAMFGKTISLPHEYPQVNRSAYCCTDIAFFRAAALDPVKFSIHEEPGHVEAHQPSI